MTNRRLDRFAPPPAGSPRFARGTERARHAPLREGNREGAARPASRGEPGGCGTPRFARETETRACSVPPACRGNLKEGVSRKITLQEVCYRKR
jgi:hypothetical protein